MNNLQHRFTCSCFSCQANKDLVDRLKAANDIIACLEQKIHVLTDWAGKQTDTAGMLRSLREGTCQQLSKYKREAGTNRVLSFGLLIGLAFSGVAITLALLITTVGGFVFRPLYPKACTGGSSFIRFCPKWKLVFIQKFLKNTSQSLLCFSAHKRQEHFPNLKIFAQVLFVRIKRDPPLCVCPMQCSSDGNRLSGRKNLKKSLSALCIEIRIL